MKKVTKFSTAGVVIAAALFAADAYAASRVQFDNFESGSPVGWQSTSCTVSRTSADGGAPRSGNYLLLCNWDGTLPWNDPRRTGETVLAPQQMQREFFVRMYFRNDRDVDVKAGSKIMRVGFGSDYEITMACQMEQGANATFWIYPINLNPFYGDGNPAARCGNNTWHKLEIYVKHDSNGADGIIRIWVDGVMAKEWVNVATKMPANLNFLSNWSSNPGWEHDANNHVAFDDIEVYTDVGTGASGSMANATITTGGTASSTLPSQPKNLHIVP